MYNGTLIYHCVGRILLFEKWDNLFQGVQATSKQGADLHDDEAATDCWAAQRRSTRPDLLDFSREHDLVFTRTFADPLMQLVMKHIETSITTHMWNMISIIPIGGWYTGDVWSSRFIGCFGLQSCFSLCNLSLPRNSAVAGLFLFKKLWGWLTSTLFHMQHLL